MQLSRSRIFLLVSVTAIAGLLLGYFGSHPPSPNRAYQDQQGFLMLSALAERMIAENAPGVVNLNGSPYIDSFSAFYDYVSRQFPVSVAPKDCGNPFPTILRGDTYRKSERCDGPDAELLISDLRVSRPIGLIQYRLTANGGVRTLASSDTTHRAGTEFWFDYWSQRPPAPTSRSNN